MNRESTSSAPRKPAGTPFWVAAGFIAAFGATIVTVILTGLYVRAPGSRATTEQAPAAASQLSNPRPGEAAGVASGRETDEGAGERRLAPR
jgi:hypothetical protein